MLYFQHTFTNNSVEYFRVGSLIIAPREPGVGINTEAIDTSAELHIQANAVAPFRGVLLPQVTDVQMGNIDNPLKGLIIYNTDKERYMYNAGTPASPSWQYIGGYKSNTAAELGADSGDFVGEIRYCSDEQKLYYWTGTLWQQIDSAP